MEVFMGAAWDGERERSKQRGGMALLPKQGAIEGKTGTI